MTSRAPSINPDLRRVLVGLMALGPCSEVKLATKLRLSEEDGFNALAALRKRDLARPVDDWRWDVTDEGRRTVLEAQERTVLMPSPRATNFWGR